MYKLNVEAPIPDKLQSARQSVQDVDIVYKFALQSFAHITMLNARQVLGSRINPGPSAIDDPESGMSDIHEEGHSDRIRTPSPSIHEMPLPEVYEPQTYGLTQGGGSSAPTSTISPAPQEKIPPSILNTQSYNPRQRGRINFEPPRIIQPPSQALSSSTSHRVNLLTLSGVSFFGAGMAWSTVFSGTRGDLVLISWAACCFIISAVISAAVTSLLDTDGNLLERFLVVRWAVRLLGIFSAIHAFVGVSLVSAAILVLDPNSSEAEAGFHGEAGGFSVVAGRAAGAYSLIVCSVGVLLVVLVRRRYSRKTWFT
ncbi:hypothetical protein ONZ45_g11992 [Pleurotus djamor]|nr:hypothetical protein ONZ45_g11992 [Pleurotus djamor]